MDQNEEINISKDEKNILIEKVLKLENEMNLLTNENNLCRNDMESIKNKNQELESRVQYLESNNEELLQRIIDEKDKTAKQINEMNSLVDGKLLIIYFMIYPIFKY
jgi:predicted  nucleic acid-binding Zn-ribbon protein